MIGAMLQRLRRPRAAAARAPGPELLFAELGRARRGVAYAREDRRRDFQAVFFGSEAGKRVLYEILAWSHVFASTLVPGDSHATHWREGGRDIGLRILAALNPEPPAGSDGRNAAVEADSGNGARS